MLLSQTFSWKKTSVFKASSLWGHNLNMTQFVEIVQVFWFWLVLKSEQYGRKWFDMCPEPVSSG